MSRSVGSLETLVVYTIWPLLQRFEDRVTSRLESFLRRVSPQASGPVVLIGGASQPYLQQLNFTLSHSDGMGFVNSLDYSSMLGDALILYRAEGGEHIVGFTISSGTRDVHVPFVLTILKTTAARLATRTAAAALTLTLVTGSDSSSLVAYEPLEAGDCIIVQASEWSEERVDGTVTIQRG